MTIKFKQHQDEMQLIYFPGDRWVVVGTTLFAKTARPLYKTFKLTKKNLIDPHILEDLEDDFVGEFEFAFAEKHASYWYINKEVLETKYDVLIHEHAFVQKGMYVVTNKDLLPSISSIKQMFVAHHNISVFKKIDDLCDEQIIIGGDIASAIPFEEFNLFIAKFPSQREIKRYAEARITNVLGEHFYSMSDGEQMLQKYFQKKEARLSKIATQQSVLKGMNIPIELYEHEIVKFEAIAQIITDELKKDSDLLSENAWQNMIIQVLPIIFPQYVAVLKKVQIKESYSDATKKTTREVDFMLINANGYADVLEIKKPFKECILNRGQYRDNYIPKRELSGSVMQVEKYIYYLNSLTKKDEESLTATHKAKLPDGLTIKIRNPKGLILLGRSCDFNDQQVNDFEFIKRKYANIADVLSYDDLLTRINNIINSLTKKAAEEE